MDDDCWIWRYGDNNFKLTFPSNKTSNQNHEQQQTIFWSTLVWFPEAILRLSFITWLAFKDRLSTDIYTRASGIIEQCYICGEPDETHDHLFFACFYYLTLWIDIVGFILGQREWILTRLSQIHNGMIFTCTPSADVCLLKLALQATIHI